MKEINLTRGMVALVDDEDYDYLNKFSWQAHNCRGKFYASCGKYINSDKNEIIYMHRLILNTIKGIDVDHIDHNTLNNQKYNLRNCTRSQNLMNRNGRGKSAFCGVSWNVYHKLWKAYITVNKKQIHLGYFKSETEAAKKRDEASKIYYKEFAHTNL